MATRLHRVSRVELASATDNDLIECTRSGNTDAYGELWVRHERSALAFARSLSASSADDLVAEAFARILRVIQNGQGPVDNFRAYLYSAIKSCFIDDYRRSMRTTSIGHDEILDALGSQGVEPDHAHLEVDGDSVRSAWSKLTRREQWLMWASAVHGYSTGEIAEQLGVKPGTAAVWVYRARERTRVAFLASHVQAAANGVCQQQRDRFVGYVRETLSDPRRGQLEQHLDQCADCRAVFDGMAGLNHRMRAVVWPLLPPSTTAAFHATSPGWFGARHAVAHAMTAKSVAVGASIGASIAAGAVVISVTQHGPARPLARAHTRSTVVSSGLAPSPGHTFAPQPGATHRVSQPPTRTSTSTPHAPTTSNVPAQRVLVTHVSTPPSAPPSSPRLRPAPPARSSSSSSSSPVPAPPPPPAALPATSSRSATFAIAILDPNRVTGTVSLSLPAGWMATGLHIAGLTGGGGVKTTLDGSNTVTIAFSAAQVADGTLALILTGVGPWVTRDVATADVTFAGATEQRITAPLL